MDEVSPIFLSVVESEQPVVFVVCTSIGYDAAPSSSDARRDEITGLLVCKHVKCGSTKAKGEVIEINPSLFSNMEEG